jgi:hypothetical protein
MAATFVSEHERYRSSGDCPYADKNGDVARGDHYGGFTENVQACLALLVMRCALLRLRRRWHWRWLRRPRDNPLEADGAAV